MVTKIIKYIPMYYFYLTFLYRLINLDLLSIKYLYYIILFFKAPNPYIMCKKVLIQIFQFQLVE